MSHLITAASPRAEELLHALEALDATLVGVRAGAGGGLCPARERELQAHLRRLRMLLGDASSALVEDVVDAARRVLESADPAAPLHVLGMARQGLAGVVRRQAASATLADAA